ncbi:hypothetical protein [Lentzea sp. NBRC 102530]|uniref:hypothetical protein n=1 Tax=Lentzea sp. NBRC 102530 TaxID=3032201 RepID=UPI002553AA17|nr:hypothetical protein [Lentzea sp. NBRC 102530]
MDVDVVAQWVKTEWTKKSRGMPGAALRNAAPVGFVLPHVSPAVHEACLYERYDFKPLWSDESDELDRWTVQLREDDGVLSVQLQETVWNRPRRWTRPAPVRLARGEWVRWQINHRFGRMYDGAWTYRLTTLNLAYGTPTDAKVFLGTPTRRVDERIHLS